MEDKDLEVLTENCKDTCVFLVATFYHYLVSVILIKVLGIEEKSIILAHCMNEEMEHYSQVLERKNYRVLVNTIENRLDYYKVPYKEHKFFIDIKRKCRNLILVNFRWNVSHVFYDAKEAYKQCDKALFIEDGPNSYVNYTGSKLYMLIKRILGCQFNFYKSEKLKSIYVSKNKEYPLAFDTKIKKLDISSLWDKLLDDQKKEILLSFIPYKSLVELKELDDVGIVYTQPLSEDGYLNEKEKIDIYDKICKYYSKYGTVVVKPHPRDQSDYKSLGYVVIENNWPSEILSFIGVHFKFAIGICTSAVTTSDADIKLNINENYLRDKTIKLIPLGKNNV